MAYVLHLRNVPPSADEGIIRRTFSRFSIPKGGIQILGGVNGQVLIDFDEETEILQALSMDGIPIHGKQIKVLLERAGDKPQIIRDVLTGIVSASKTKADSVEVDKRSPSKPVNQKLSSRQASSATPATVNVAQSASQVTEKTSTKVDRIAAAPWNIKARSNDSPAANQQASGQTASTAKSPKSLPPWASKAGQAGNQKSAEVKQLPPIAKTPPWANKTTPSPSPQSVPVTTPRLQTQTALTTAPQAAAQMASYQMMGQVMQNTALPQNQLSGNTGIITRPPISYQMVRQVMPNTSFSQPQRLGMSTRLPISTPYQMVRQGMPNMSLSRPQMAGGVGLNTRATISTNYQMVGQLRPNMSSQPQVASYQMVRQVLPNTSSNIPSLFELNNKPPVSASHPWSTQGTPSRQPVPAPTKPTTTQWGSQVAMSPSPIPVAAPNPQVALAADVARKASMSTNRFSSPNLVGTPLLMRAITPQNVALAATNAASISKSMPMSTSVPLAFQSLKPDGLKQKKPPAEPILKNPISEVIVVKESDDEDSSGENDEYQVEVKKRKVGNGSGANNVKSASEKEQIKNRIYRSKGRSPSPPPLKEKDRSKSRSRSRSRSRSHSKTRRPRRRDSSSPEEVDAFGRNKKRRERSRSRGRDRSRSRDRSRRSRSRSRGRNHDRSRSRDRHRSRSKGRDRSIKQKSTNTDKEKSKPAVTVPPGLVQYPDRMNIGTAKFINDPNSIIVQNISKTVSMYQFRELFYGHPIVQDGIALKPSENNPNVQTGYVRFVHKSSAEAAKKLSGTPVDGRKVVIKLASEGESGPPPEPEFRETLKSPLKTLDIPPPRESPIRKLGASEQTTCYISTIRGFNPGTTACEVWSWFGGPPGHVKGVIVSHRVRKKDDEAAFVIFNNVALRNEIEMPRDMPNLVHHRYTEQATIRKLLSDDVSVLTESTLFGQDRAITEAEKKRLGVLSSKFLEPGLSASPHAPAHAPERALPHAPERAPEQPLWKRLTYLCLYETPKGSTASQVWSWFGGENGRARSVVLAHCTSQNELNDGRYHVAFVGFRDAHIVRQEIQKIGHGRQYTADETMSFLARHPDSCPIFLTTTYKEDHVLPKTEREQLRQKYLNKEDVIPKRSSDAPKPNPMPSWKDFGLSDDFSSLYLLQHKIVPKTSTACKVWSWHQLESNKCKGVVLVKEPDGSAPRFAFAAFDDVEVRNEAHKMRQYTGKATWISGMRYIANCAANGAPVFISTKSGIDRPITYEESSYLIQNRDAGGALSSLGSPMEIEGSSDEEEEQNQGMATPRTQTSDNNQMIHKKAAIAAVAGGDDSDQHFYLRIRKLPEKVTACRVWSWFEGAEGNSKKALVVYGANKVAACAYIEFRREIHRDMALTNQRFANPCNYHSRAVYLTELEPGFKIMESTVSGLDREFTEFDMDVMKYKLRQIVQQKKADKPLSNFTVPDNITRRAAPVAEMNTQIHMPSPKIRQEERNPGPPPREQSMWGQGTQGVTAPKEEKTMSQRQGGSRWNSQVHEDRKPKVPEPTSQAPKILPPGTERRNSKAEDSVENMLQPENTIYFRLIKLRPNITAGEVWSWFRGSRGPTRCATLVRDSDGTALFAFVGFVTDHTSFIENFEIGSFTLCGPKARNIELISLDTSVQVIQSSKQGDKRVSAETMTRFKERVLGQKRTGATETQPDVKHDDSYEREPSPERDADNSTHGYGARKQESQERHMPPSNLQGLTARILQIRKY